MNQRPPQSAPVCIEKIKQQARDAAAVYTNINDACPYPFGSDEAHAFKAEFTWVRSVIEEKEREGAAL